MLGKYITSIIIISVLAVILENLLPEGSYKKYINVNIGLVVMLVIIRPLTALPHYRDAFFIPYVKIEESAIQNDALKNSFEEKLAERIDSEIYAAFGVKTSTSINADTNEKGQITQITSVRIKGASEEIKEFAKRKFGLNREVIE